MTHDIIDNGFGRMCKRCGRFQSDTMFPYECRPKTQNSLSWQKRFDEYGKQDGRHPFVWQNGNINWDAIKSFIDGELDRQREECKEDYIEYIFANSYGNEYKGKTPFREWRVDANVRDMSNWD